MVAVGKRLLQLSENPDEQTLHRARRRDRAVDRHGLARRAVASGLRGVGRRKNGLNGERHAGVDSAAIR